MYLSSFYSGDIVEPYKLGKRSLSTKQDLSKSRPDMWMTMSKTLTSYERCVVIESRAVNLSNNEPTELVLANYHDNSRPSYELKSYCEENGIDYIPIPREDVDDILDIAELEFGMGALDNSVIVRNTASDTKKCVTVSELFRKSTY